jgi:hypothetical protein
MIPRMSKSGRILHPPKTPLFNTSTQHGNPLSLAATCSPDFTKIDPNDPFTDINEVFDESKT